MVYFLRMLLEETVLKVPTLPNRLYQSRRTGNQLFFSSNCFQFEDRPTSIRQASIFFFEAKYVKHLRASRSAGVYACTQDEIYHISCWDAAAKCDMYVPDMRVSRSLSYLLGGTCTGPVLAPLPDRSQLCRFVCDARLDSLFSAGCV